MIKRITAIIALLALLISMSTLGTLSAAAASSDWINHSSSNKVDYSFAVLGDIQTITYSDTHSGTSYLATMFDWILANRESRKIEYVIGLGDTVETLRSTQGGGDLNPKEWKKVRSQLRKLLEAGMPHLIVRGNHDDERGYHQYVCTEEYKNQMDGFFYDDTKTAIHGNSMSNCYRKLEIGNHKYLMLGLDYNSWDDEETLAWASEVVSSNPDYKVILSIHSYIHRYGSAYNGEIGSASANYLEQESIYFSGQTLWDDFISKHENMFMVLCGHVATKNPVVKMSMGDSGNKIYTVLVDPQAYEEEDPSGFVLMLNVVNGGEALEIEYLSTSKVKHFRANNQMTLELPTGTFPKYIPTVVTTVPETTTEVPTTEEPTVVTEAVSEGGCRGAVSVTVAVCCSMGTALAAFALRRRKEN